MLAALLIESATFAASAATLPADGLALSANGIVILDPTSKKSHTFTDGGRKIEVPDGMVYIPPSDFTPGAGATATKVHLDGFCIGQFDVTNVEYKAFLTATHSQRFPSYWTDGSFPKNKANHPVAFVSLTDATAYAEWVSKATGRKIVIPTANQWERAARGPSGYLFPWGNSIDVRVDNGSVTSKFNFNAVIAAQCLKDEPKRTVVYDNPKSKYFNKVTTVDQIAAFDASGNAKYLSVSANGMVSGWVNHDTYTGFIYTDLFTSLNRVGGATSPVGTYVDGKSSYGCYDMAGNVWNWCSTTIVSTNGAERGKTVNEVRGGSWYATGRSCQSISIGEGRMASGEYNTVGFRIAMIPSDAGDR